MPLHPVSSRLINPISVRKNPVLVACLLVLVAYGLGAGVIVLPLYLAGLALVGGDASHPTTQAHEYFAALFLAYTVVFAVAVMKIREWLAPWPR